MILAAIITTAIIVVILQIITIANVAGTKKLVRDQLGKANSALSNDRNGERRDRDFRFQNKRPIQDQRPKSPAPATPTSGSVDTVEKSLRDINLKLKNAERDQEFARKRVQENLSKDQNRRHGNNNNNNRGGRDNRDHRHNNGNNRDRRGGNWQERNKNREALSFSSSQPTEETAITENQNILLNQETQIVQQEPVSQNTQAAVTVDSTPELVPNDFASDENLQHGRKILVKRRMLKEGDEEQSESSTENSSSESPAGNVSESNETSSNVVEKTSEGEIKFGRR